MKYARYQQGRKDVTSRLGHNVTPRLASQLGQRLEGPYFATSTHALSSYVSIMRPPYLRTHPLMPPLRMTDWIPVSPTSSK
ncbi:hypothetical protein CH063_13415 [Colletotrichum higginsianum]|uniref:Uncharacterized protein n=1 Tax=Colletotrichum higginsianum (strain IMI 349063) TaxID=759273 RepID=H1VUB3_COLHI|nr:hypothetical protein CH063_13415 [Colletotrichum higginsianum]